VFEPRTAFGAWGGAKRDEGDGGAGGAGVPQGGECFTEACSVLGADALGNVIRKHVEQRVQAKLGRREVSE
jgi:hypothetical protein